MFFKQKLQRKPLKFKKTMVESNGSFESLAAAPGFECIGSV